jgi:hypothetical protein
VIFEPEIPGEALEGEPILLAVQLEHLRMRLTGHDVQRIGVAFEDGGHGRDRRLDPLARGDEAEGGQDAPVCVDRARRFFGVAAWQAE